MTLSSNVRFPAATALALGAGIVVGSLVFGGTPAATQSADPDPGTDQQTTLEVRILRQLQARGIPVNQLNREVQQALEGATLR